MIGSRASAEAIGTFLLVLIGPGTAAVAAWGGQPGGVTVPIAFGLVILACVYAFGHISGAHLNPAVTVAFAVSGTFPRRDVAPYVAAQLAGAAAAALVLRLIVGSHADAAVTHLAISPVAGLMVEVLLSFLLMLVVLAVATDARVAGGIAGLAVGSAVTCDALMGGALTGASMNPARSFGPALANGAWSDHWVYWIGPLSGAMLAVPVYAYLRKGTAHDSRT